MSKFYDAVTKNTLRDKINRICGVTDEVFSLREKLAEINAALDRYWQLASDAAPKGTFDDENQTAYPMETQNLVAGTNAYKVSSFTSNILQILKIAILDDDADEHDLIREEFDDIDEFYETYTTTVADRGEPTYWTKMGDYIYLRPCPDYSETSGLRAYVNRELSKFSYVTFTVTIASPGVITAVAHGLSNSDIVLLSTNGTLPTGFTVDTTVYYLVSKATDTFQLATVPSGTAINTSGSQTGTHGFIQINKEPGIPVIHHDFLARYAGLSFLIEKNLPQTSGIAQLVAKDEQAILDYWQNRDRDLRTIIKPMIRSFK